MFRLFLTTFQKLPKHYSTSKRKIISQKDNQIQFSPTSSPQKKTPYSVLPQLKDYQFILGQFYLFRRHQNIKLETYLKKQSERQISKPFSSIRSNILLGVNIQQEDTVELNQKLKKVQYQIQNIDFIQCTQNNQICVVIIFKSLSVSEYFHTYFTEQKFILSVYLENMIIYEQQINTTLKSKFIYPEIMKMFQSQLIYVSTLNNNQDKQEWIQLPKCSVCLQKLQYELTGFNQQYLKLIQLKSLKDPKCKCRTCRIIFQQNSPLQKSQIIFCSLCKQKTDIWICMICGQIGCGRYKNADAYKHFVQSGHVIALDLQTHRVWNYLADCFSHRLTEKNNLQNQYNIVKFPKMQYQDDVIKDTVLQGAFWQYCSIFSEQMQKQRIFYQQIRKKQRQKFECQNQKLQKMVRQFSSQIQGKKYSLKKLIKNQLKLQKKQKLVNEEMKQERQKLNQFQLYLKTEIDVKQITNDQQVMSKKKILQQLEKQISQVLVKLTQS